MNTSFLRPKTRRRTDHAPKRGLITALLALVLLAGFAIPPNVNANALDAPQVNPDTQVEPSTVDPTELVAPKEDPEQQSASDTAETSSDATAPQTHATPEAAPPADPLQQQQPEQRSENSVDVAELSIEARATPPVLQEDEAAIVVRAGGIRTVAAGRPVEGLAGVELALHEPVATLGDPVGEALPDSWASCVTDATGVCYFVIPETAAGQANYDRQFMIAQTAAPEGWYMNPKLRVNIVDAPSTQSYADDQPYVFQTGNWLRAGKTYTAGTDFMRSYGGEARYRSIGTWQNSLDNPEFVCRVGLRVALVLDLSNSVRPYLGDLKEAAIGFVEALEGTGSSVALFTFSSNAPHAAGTTGRNYAPTPVDGNVETLTNRINGYTATGATNWDSGMYQVAASDHQFDLALVVTDGMPTYHRNDVEKRIGGDGHNTRMLQVESAIYSANALKSKADPALADHFGTRLVAVGVGKAINADPANLAAVSGQEAFDPALQNAKDADYFQVEWEELQGALADIAETAICSAQVQIVKEVERGNAADRVSGGSGWTFDMSTTAGAVWGEPNLPNSLAQTRVTDTSGTTKDLLHFAASDAPDVTVSLSEVMQQSQIDANWALTDVTCTVNDAPVTPTLNDALDAQLTVGVADKVICTFVNTQSENAELSLVKRGWATVDVADVMDPNSMNPAAAEIPRGDSQPLGEVVTWTYDVTNLGDTLIRDIRLVDNRLPSVTCPATSLPAGETMRCFATGTLFPIR